jgi:hypothetical protein
MRWRCDFGERCGREKPRLAAATSGAVWDRHRQSQCLRVLQRSTAVCAGAKNTKSLAACAGSCGAGSQPMPGANAMWNTAGRVLLGDVAARDVQAATSPANRIAPARTKSWRFAGGGLGSGGENPTRQRPSLCMTFRVGNRRSANSPRCGREKPRLAAATSLRYRVATGPANVFGFCSGAPPFVPQRKTRSLWLSIKTSPCVTRSHILASSFSIGAYLWLNAVRYKIT